MKGRKPKPYLVKAAAGNPGKRKLQPGVQPAATPFDPPMPLEGAAAEEWRRVVSEATWLRAPEAAAIADRCLCWARLLEAEADIAERGFIVRTRNGKVKNPSVQIAREYRKAIQAYDAALGLTTIARERLSPAKPEGGDALENALCG